MNFSVCIRWWNLNCKKWMSWRNGVRFWYVALELELGLGLGLTSIVSPTNDMQHGSYMVQCWLAICHVIPLQKLLEAHVLNKNDSDYDTLKAKYCSTSSTSVSETIMSADTLNFGVSSICRQITRSVTCTNRNHWCSARTSQDADNKITMHNRCWGNVKHNRGTL